MQNEFPLGLIAIFFFVISGICTLFSLNITESDSRWGEIAPLLLFVAGIFFGWACWLTFKAVGV